MGIETALLGAAVIGGGASLIGGSMAANAQQDAAQSQIDLSRDIYGQQQQMFQPYYDTGTNALAAYNYELGLGAAPAGYTGFQATPGYQWSLDQANDAIQGSAAAQGNVLSGATMQALQGNAIGMANQQYNNYLAQLGGLASAGQAAAGQQATAIGNMGAAQNNALAAQGNASSAAWVNAGNAVNDTINNAASTYGYLSMQPQQPLFGGNSWG